MILTTRADTPQGGTEKNRLKAEGKKHDKHVIICWNSLKFPSLFRLFLRAWAIITC